MKEALNININILNYLLFYSGEIPDYINQTLDAIFKVEGESCKIYFCGDNELKRSDVEFIQINDLNNDYIKEVKNLKYFENESNFLWESSFLRIFYLYELAKKLNIDSFIHFDCDVLIYKPYKSIKNSFVDGKINITPLNEIFLNFSYSYIDNLENFKNTCDSLIEIIKNSNHYEKKYYEGQRLNEMIMLNIAYIKNPENFNLLKVLPENDCEYIFDPGSYGQYIGGTHNKLFSKKFINDDHYVGRKILSEGYKIYFQNGIPTVRHLNKTYKLVNLHVHSKKLKKYV